MDLKLTSQETKLPAVRKKTNRVGIWKDKVYTKQILEYVEHSLRDDEKAVYKTIFDSLVAEFDIKGVNEIMLLDLAVTDYIRVKRLHLILKEESDIVTIKTRQGQNVRKVHEAGYMINAIEGQFRQNMKELLLTPRERIKKTIGEQPKDFTEALGVVIDAEFVDDGKDGSNNDEKSGTDKIKEKKTKA